MKSVKELLNDLNSNEAIAKEFADALREKREAGAHNYYETIIPVAEEMGYAVSKEELDEIIEDNSKELTEEELGKVAGGTSCLEVSVAITYYSVLISLSVSVVQTVEKYKD